MKPNDIRVGATYRNRGEGRTTRTVLGIGRQFRPTRWYMSDNSDEHECGVQFRDHRLGVIRYLYLSRFARWAGEEVEN